MKTLLIASLLFVAAVAVAPTASAAVDPCDAYGVCYSVGTDGVFVGDCQKLTCAGVWTTGDAVCAGFSYQVPQCVPTD